MREAVIVSAVRTPIGAFGGVLKDISAVQLGEIVIKGALQKCGVATEQVDEVIIGNVLNAGLGQNVARQMSVRASIPYSTPAFTVNKVCGSGLKAIQLAAQTILLGDANVVVAGGVENMSQAPYVLEQERWGMRMGHAQVIDTMLRDGLSDAFEQYHMGITAENIAEQFKISRELQDQYAYNSQQKAQKAITTGRFQAEIIPVEVPQRRGEPIVCSTDEYPRSDVTLEKLAQLRPAFKKDGTVTAGNASGINDGAAAVVVMNRQYAEQLGLPILAKIKAYADAGVDPAIMGCGPIEATRKVLAKANLSLEQIDLIEANEAFAVQAYAVARELGVDPAKVNVNGGAIALGHPIGASGARVLVTLIHEMQKRHSQFGLATLCIGGGMGTALILENE